jgi:hypothetical protein
MRSSKFKDCMEVLVRFEEWNCHMPNFTQEMPYH